MFLDAWQAVNPKDLENYWINGRDFRFPSKLNGDSQSKFRIILLQKEWRLTKGNTHTVKMDITDNARS